MKTFLNTLGGTLLVLGIMAMAGSAGDCDGACMEQANTVGEMLMIAALGLAACVTGGILIAQGGGFEQE